MVPSGVALESRVSFVHESANRVLVVTNPTAGIRSRHESIWDLEVLLKERGLVPEIVTDLSALAAQVEQYQEAGQLRAVVAAGGDGTVAEIVNRTRPDVPITVFPLGTANLLASYFGIDADPLSFAHIVADGATVQLDAGRANGRVFLLMAGCGFDADVVHRMHRQRAGRHINYWTYARPILEAIRSYRYPGLRVYCELPNGSQRPSANLSVRWAFVTNLPCYAGGLKLAPRAIGTDGLLNVSTFDSGSLWHGLRYVGYALLGQPHLLTDYRANLVTRVRIESDEPVPYQLDGDPGGWLPLEIEVLPERLRMVAPLKRLAALGLTAAEAPSREKSAAMERGRA